MIDRARLANMMPLSEAVPGWEGSHTREVVERTARGVALEQERLRGSQFLVVTRFYELDLDGISRTITIEGGHAGLNDALAHAQRVCSERLVAEGLKHAEVPEWRHGTPLDTWLKVAPRWNGTELPVFGDRLSDGTGWIAVEVAVAVIPTKPDTPINIDVINTIDMTSETVSWFGEVLKESDQLISRIGRFVWTEDDIVIRSPDEVAARIEAQDAVDRDQALWLLAERAVLTRAVCRELQDSGGEFYGRRPFRALAQLLEWVHSNFPESGPSPRCGLDAMVVPEDCQDLLREIRDGAEVCAALDMLTTADNALEEEGDKEAIARKLAAYWEAHAQIVNPPWR